MPRLAYYEREGEGTPGGYARHTVLWHGDDDFRSGVSLLHISDGARGLAQRVTLVDRRGELSVADERADGGQVVFLHLCNKESELLPQERGPRPSFEQSR